MIKCLSIDYLLSRRILAITPVFETGKGGSIPPGTTNFMRVWWNGIHSGLKIRRFGMRVQIPPPVPFYAYVSQLAEELVLETRCCQFKSDRRYHFQHGRRLRRFSWIENILNDNADDPRPPV